MNKYDPILGEYRQKDGITGSEVPSFETDPLSLHLNQTAPQTVLNGAPNFSGGLVVGNTLQTNGGRIVKITTVTDTYQILVTDNVIICDKATPFTSTLPTAVIGQRFIIKNIGAGVVTLEGSGSDTIDGDLNQAIYQWEGVQAVCYAANKWAVI